MPLDKNSLYYDPVLEETGSESVFCGKHMTLGVSTLARCIPEKDYITKDGTKFNAYYCEDCNEPDTEGPLCEWKVFQKRGYAIESDAAKKEMEERRKQKRLDEEKTKKRRQEKRKRGHRDFMLTNEAGDYGLDEEDCKRLKGRVLVDIRRMTPEERKKYGACNAYIDTIFVFDDRSIMTHKGFEFSVKN